MRLTTTPIYPSRVRRWSTVDRIGPPWGTSPEVSTLVHRGARPFSAKTRAADGPCRRQQAYRTDWLAWGAQATLRESVGLTRSRTLIVHSPRAGYWRPSLGQWAI